MDKTRQAVQTQIAAMGACTYEVGLFDPEAERTGRAVMIPRTWDVAALLRSVSWLRYQNSTGRNIYVRPRGEHNLSLVDDLSAASVERMKSTGFAPALVVETSPGNFQAWLKHPRPLAKDLSTAVARRLAREFGGDVGAADWRHFGRLAGFTNRKIRHRMVTGLFPFVRIAEASGREYDAGPDYVSKVERELHEEAARRESDRSQPQRHRANGRLKSIDSFRSNSAYGGDGTRIDLAYSIYALSHGCSVAEVDAAIRSRSLAHKGTEKRQNEYVERTIRKAAEVIEQKGFARPRSR